MKASLNEGPAPLPANTVGVTAVSSISKGVVRDLGTMALP